MNIASGHYAKAYIHNATTNRMYSAHGARTMPQVAEPKRHQNQLLKMKKGKLKERMMSARRIPMMTEDEIQAELGWIRFPSPCPTAR
jgi:hypothetical protein